MSLVEIQQNNDITFRLFDYGRPRPLQLEEGLAVADLEPYRLRGLSVSDSRSTSLLTRTLAAFCVDSLILTKDETIQLGEAAAWFVPLTGRGWIDDMPYASQQCWIVEGNTRIRAEQDTHALIATSF